jgi:hypothetical protein
VYECSASTWKHSHLEAWIGGVDRRRRCTERSAAGSQDRQRSGPQRVRSQVRSCRGVRVGVGRSPISMKQQRWIRRRTRSDTWELRSAHPSSSYYRHITGLSQLQKSWCACAGAGSCWRAAALGLRRSDYELCSSPGQENGQGHKFRGPFPCSLPTPRL